MTQAGMTFTASLLEIQAAIAAELDPMIVTAIPTARAADDTLASITVVDRVDFARFQARSVQNLLRGLPGIGIAKNGGAVKSTSVFTRGSGFSTGGFNACDGRPSPGGRGCFTVEPEHDGCRTLPGSLRAGSRFENGFEIEGHRSVLSSDDEFERSSVNEGESLRRVYGGKASFPPTGFRDLSLSGGRSLYESDSFDDGAFPSRVDTEPDTLFFQNGFANVDDHPLTLAVDYRVDRTAASAVTSRDNTALFAQYPGSIGGADSQPVPRCDDNQPFGLRTTGGAAFGYTLSGNLRLTGSFGTVFKASTLNGAYFPNFGNPNLHPVESRCPAFALSDRDNREHWSINIYEIRIDHLIAVEALTFAPANIDQARIAILPDRAYKTAEFCNRAGRSLFVTLRYQA